ncbi:MAG: trypsin-like peptidase domain-containing protein [Bacteriovoracaceae bacterium]|nr:trypsin-like peptidase domain-containing protein [Bacteriovoracaceae bacterium]
MQKIKLLPSLVFVFYSLSSFALFGIGDKEEKNDQMAIEKLALLESEKNTVNVFEKNVRSVVNVSNIRIARTGWWFHSEEMEVPAGAGSGFVWDEEGHIVTNYHVIANGDSFVISFHKDKETYEAEVVGAYPQKDIAVLKLKKKPKKLYPIIPGTSRSLRVGQKAMAIGNPFGLDHTMTSGIISATDRKIRGVANVTINGMIQTDCSINPGNSGGPLYDSQGQVIGMNTMIYSASGSSAGVGFSVPVDTIKGIVPQIIKHGKVKRPGLGIGLLEERLKYHFGIEKGIVVKYVDPKSPAASAGLEGMSRDPRGRYLLGDIILKIDGKEVNNYDEIFNVLDKYNVGDSVQIDYLRGDSVKKTKLKLMEI